ncbi:hypothetical protein O181_004348 [Austropuccinia psidii MF-1]|uniref:Uncharacterized protein n=1 Tax=Austropuccinia psidii MF-1 TaxID=1389203 RepID=A0A9Q3GEG2_9BASI|nr:hypothetical protein [Austropuccinia psidii MF-1]
MALPPLWSYIFPQYTATHHGINSLKSSRQICSMGKPIHNTIYDFLGIIPFITKPQSSDQDNWSPFILDSLSKGSNDILCLELRCTKTTHLKYLPTISHHYELLPLIPTIQKEYSKLYKEFLSSKSKGPGEFFRSVNKLCIFCNHHIVLHTMVDPDLEDHEGRSTEDNSSTIIITIVDVETCMMSSKIAHLFESLLKSKQSKFFPTKSVVYTQWTHSLDLRVNSNENPLPFNPYDHILLAYLVFHFPITLSFQHELMGQLQYKGRRRLFRDSSIILNVKYSFHSFPLMELAST